VIEGSSYSLSDAAAVLGVSVPTVRALVARSQLTSTLIMSMFGSFLPSLGRQQPQSTRVEGADIVMKSSPDPGVPDVRYRRSSEWKVRLESQTS